MITQADITKINLQIRNATAQQLKELHSIVNKEVERRCILHYQLIAESSNLKVAEKLLVHSYILEHQRNNINNSINKVQLKYDTLVSEEMNRTGHDLEDLVRINTCKSVASQMEQANNTFNFKAKV